MKINNRDPFGLEISGIEVAGMRGAQIAEIIRHLSRHGVIVFRDQDIDDNGFDVFLRTQGVELVLWNPALMHEPSALPAKFANAYLKLMRAQSGNRILAGRNPELDRPPGDPFWDRLHQQLNWRAIIAGRNEGIAMHIKKMTETVKAKTLAYLKGHRS